MSLVVHLEKVESGIDWLGEIPVDWEVMRLRHVAELNPSKSEVAEVDRDQHVSFLPMEAIGDDGTIELEKSRPIGAVESGYTYFRDGDVTLAKITPCFENGKGAIMRDLLNGIGFGTTELIVARPREERITGEYLNWLFRSTYFRKLGEGSMYGAGGQKRVPDDFVRNFEIAIPPLNEQKAISSFLDVETSKIDALVSEQRRLIELLKEKRQAVISHAVTKGLNPNAPLKPSGIQWLGDIPEHWDVKSVRYACDVHNTLRTPIDRQTRLNIAGDFPYYGPTGVLSWINKYVVDGEYFLLGEDGDHFLKYRTQSMTVNVEGQFNVNNHAHLIRGKGNCSTKWASLYFEHKDVSPWLIKQGVGRMKLRKEKLLTIPILVPPPAEQMELLAEADRMRETTRSLIAEAERAIELFQERRTALISAAVTGKIDVRNFARQEVS